MLMHFTLLINIASKFNEACHVAKGKCKQTELQTTLLEVLLFNEIRHRVM